MSNLAKSLLIILAMIMLVSAPTRAGQFIMIAGDMDEAGGRSYSANFRLLASAAGQPSPIGVSYSSHFKLLSGFVYASIIVSGDVDGSGSVDISDVVFLIAYIFGGGPPPTSMVAGDANCDGTVDISDVVYVIAFIFGGGPAPGLGC